MAINQFLVLLTNSLLFTLTVLLAIPIAVLLIECLAALGHRSSRLEQATVRPSLAVLVPAHNEAVGIGTVLDRLKQQLLPQDRLIVIADNCTDETATIARAAGAMVLERQDATRRGKGYALDYGIQFLQAQPPQVVVMVDADCLVENGTIDEIARLAKALGKPIQATYLMEQPKQPTPKDAVSALAFLVKNQVRPQGLWQMGFPCLLTGTGMAFPWWIISSASLASGNLVEDMQLAVDLAITGRSPYFYADGRVTGLLPQQEHAAKSQRTRWEHGHLRTMQTQIPRLLKVAIDNGRLDLLVLALDLCVPPLSLLVMLWLATTSLAALSLLIHTSPLFLIGLAIEGIGLMVAILSAWLKYGRNELPLSALLAAPLYVLWKIPLYFAFLVRPETKWVRTDRD